VRQPRSKAAELTLPYSSLLGVAAGILKHALLLVWSENLEGLRKKPRGRRSAIELASPLLDNCITRRFVFSCKALHHVPSPYTDVDPNFQLLLRRQLPSAGWCFPPPLLNSLQNLVQWDNSHSFVEVGT